jgi:hypothetical protein
MALMTHDVGIRLQALTMFETGYKIPEIVTATSAQCTDSAKWQKNKDTTLILVRNSSLLMSKMLLAFEGEKGSTSRRNGY